MGRRPVDAVLVLVVALLTLPTLAVSVQSWDAATGEAFDKGTLDGTQIDGRGRVLLSPEFRTLWGPEEGLVWAVAPDGSGGAFVGQSGPGRVVHVSGSGDAAVWHDLGDEALITALAADGAGGVFVGVSPLGKVLHVRGPGDAEELAETGSEFVWALLNVEGHLWIGTGVPGKILVRLPGGTIETRLESPQDPIRCLAPLPDGRVVAGTGQRGRVIRVGASEPPFVLFDAEQTEIVSVAPDHDGGLYVLAAGIVSPTPSRRASPPTLPQPDVTVRVTPEAPPDNPNGNDEPPPARPPTSRPPARPGAVLHRIDRDGGTWRMWQSTTDVPYAVIADSDGFPIVATGDRGRLVRLDDQGRAVALLGFPSATVTSLVRAADGRILIGGSGDARLAVLGPETAPTGTYRTEPIDAGSVAEWGRLEWDAEVPRGATLTARVRSGNTAEPDETWSSWKDVSAPRGSTAVEVTAPAARWLQVEIVFGAKRTGPGARLRRVTTFFRPQNRPPRIETLAVESPGVAWVRIEQQGGAGRGPLVANDPVSKEAARAIAPARRGSVIRRSYESGARTFSWKAEDPDQDALVFDLEFRREGGETWHPLATRVDDSFFSWDSRGMPDGEYRVRLLADDSAGNAPGTGFVRERVSDPFRIDHTPPEIADLAVEVEASEFVVTFEARDPGGRIAVAEFALEAGKWEPIDPVDGIADSATENYRLVVKQGSGANGERSLRLRVVDTLGNLGGDFTVLSDR